MVLDISIVKLSIDLRQFHIKFKGHPFKRGLKSESPWRVDSCVSVGLDPDNRFMVNKILPEILTVFCNPLGVDFDFNPERIWRQYHPTASGRSTTLHIHEKAGSWIFDTAWRYRRNKLPL